MESFSRSARLAGLHSVSRTATGDPGLIARRAPNAVRAV